jgi:UDP-N-acetylmuramoyl-L-alanyl-D-glutamate--2,6-diaminopimelate ligase
MIASERLFEGQAILGELPRELAGVARDSRVARAGEAYVAMGRPEEQAGHAAQALAAGVGVVLGEQPIAQVPKLVWVAHARWAFARASAAAHGVDRGCPPLLGATGTKGKSTVTHFAWTALGRGAARVGTIGWHDGREERANAQTTPPPDELHRFLAGLAPGCQGVALEVSSHGADQHRLAGLRLRALSWTGIGHDHLDYHGSRASYLAAKLRAPRWLEDGGACVVNGDDETAFLAIHAGRAAGARTVALGFGDARQLQGTRAHEIACIARTEGGYCLTLRGHTHRVSCQLPGDFNAWNAAAGALMAEAAGVPLELAIERIAAMPAVPGRMELLARSPTTYVDYAHTAESIAAAIAALRAAHPGRRLGIVFGCGGDRDRTKRPLMGRAAAAADVVVVTTDNSRSESPQAIAKDILAGIPAGMAVVELERGPAILRARQLVGADGVVVVAGKGHETYQLIQGRTLSWDDRAFVRALAGHPAGGQG